MNWFEENKLDDITQSEFENLCDELAKKKVKVDEIESELKKEKEEEEALKSKIIFYLKQANKNTHTGRMCTVTLAHQRSWKLPGTPEEQDKLKNYLHAQGLERMVTVNSQTLNAYMREIYRNAEEAGTVAEVSVPGVGDMYIRETIQVRKR